MKKKFVVSLGEVTYDAENEDEAVEQFREEMEWLPIDVWLEEPQEVKKD